MLCRHVITYVRCTVQKLALHWRSAFLVTRPPDVMPLWKRSVFHLLHQTIKTEFGHLQRVSTNWVQLVQKMVFWWMVDTLNIQSMDYLINLVQPIWTIHGSSSYRKICRNECIATRQFSYLVIFLGCFWYNILLTDYRLRIIFTAKLEKLYVGIFWCTRTVFISEWNFAPPDSFCGDTPHLSDPKKIKIKNA